MGPKEKATTTRNGKRGARVQPVRRLVQYGFLAVTLLIGFQFCLFVSQLEQGYLPQIERPPGVEAFLPISALISLNYWIQTGVFNGIHPSGLVILLLVLATAVLAKKAFCSHVCPFGLLSEYLSKIHVWIMGKPRRLPRLLDYPLRSLKYLLLLFFAWAIFVEMDAHLERFVYSYYNRAADIKMYQFFADISQQTASVLCVLVVLSILIRNFWCRYLCPYGALLGALSWLSIFKVQRNGKTCIDCKKCTLACPSDIQVHKSAAVFSDECHACLQCVDACPVKNTLYFSATENRGRLPKFLVPAMVVLLFLGGIMWAKKVGRWQNRISMEEYAFHVAHINSPLYHHARGQVPQTEGPFSSPERFRPRDGKSATQGAVPE